MTELIYTTICAVTGVGVSSLFIGRLISKYRNPPVESAPPAEICLTRYKMMERLATEKDLAYMRSLPGYRPEMGKKLQRERRRIYRLYLQEIAADFRTLHSAAKALVTEAPEEHADLVGLLFQQQFSFWRAMATVELRLAMEVTGVPQINLAGLMGGMDQLRSALVQASAA